MTELEFEKHDVSADELDQIVSNYEDSDKYEIETIDQGNGLWTVRVIRLRGDVAEAADSGGGSRDHD